MSTLLSLCNFRGWLSVITLYCELLQGHANFNIAPKTLPFMEAKRMTFP